MSKTKNNTVQNIEIHGNDVVIVNGLKLNSQMIANLELLNKPEDHHIIFDGILQLMSSTMVISNEINVAPMLHEDFAANMNNVSELMTQNIILNA